MIRALVLCLALLAVTGCGPTVGDACTTTSECGGSTCINRDFTPGGYCSQACSVGAANTCPAGTLCVHEALGKNTAGCMRACSADKECRNGYVCRFAKDSTGTVCIGPAGI